MKIRDNGIYLLHIGDSFEKILQYLQNISEDEFATNLMVQDAVIRNYEIIGEATKNLSENFRNNNPEIDWRGLAGFRDVLIHQYFGIDILNIWNISSTQAQGLLEKIKALPEYQIAKANIAR